MKIFLFTYRFAGDRYSLELPAESEGEARRKAAELRQTLEYEGMLGMKIPSATGSWLPRLLVRLLNFRRGLT